MSVNIVSQVQSSTFGHNLPTLQRGLSAIAELLVGHESAKIIEIEQGLAELQSNVEGHVPQFMCE